MTEEEAVEELSTVMVVVDDEDGVDVERFSDSSSPFALDRSFKASASSP